MLRALTGRSEILALTGVLALTGALLVTPATGAATGIVTRIRHAVDHLTGSSRGGQPFDGVAAVGALFTTSNGKLANHFCTASVVNSPSGDLALTAAHCMAGESGPVVFVPEYHNGEAPFGVWQVTHVYTDSAWNASQSTDDDFAFIALTDPAEGVPVEDITGAEQLGQAPLSKTYVQVIGYPDSESQPVQCANWTKSYSATQLEFDCDGYTTGTSGSPFLASVSTTTGEGTVIGVIGGYEQGGDTPSVSYASAFGSSVEALYKTATTTKK